MRLRPTVGLLHIEGSPFLAISEIGWRLRTAGSLRFHAATGHQFTQHLAEQRAPLVLRRRTAFGVNHPIFCFTAQGLSQFLRPVVENITEPALASGATFQ